MPPIESVQQVRLAETMQGVIDDCIREYVAARRLMAPPRRDRHAGETGASLLRILSADHKAVKCQ